MRWTFLSRWTFAGAVAAARVALGATPFVSVHGCSVAS